MNCDAVRGLLPLFVYEDLESAASLAVARHLADCAACQAEHAAVMQTRSALEAAPTPAVNVDALALLRRETARQALRIRRWRRAALAVGALAASLLLILALRVEVRAGDGRLTVSWGAPKPDTRSPIPEARDPAPEITERLQLVQEIARALAADVAERDDRQQAAVARLRTELDNLQRFTVDRWRATERDVATLYRTTFPRTESGENQ
jgi:anti-sigma factor RsiW